MTPSYWLSTPEEAPLQSTNMNRLETAKLKLWADMWLSVLWRWSIHYWLWVRFLLYVCEASGYLCVPCRFSVASVAIILRLHYTQQCRFQFCIAISIAFTVVRMVPVEKTTKIISALIPTISIIVGAWNKNSFICNSIHFLHYYLQRKSICLLCYSSLIESWLKNLEVASLHPNRKPSKITSLLSLS